MKSRSLDLSDVCDPEKHDLNCTQARRSKQENVDNAEGCKTIWVSSKYFSECYF
jgi:hypothetical protein